MVFDLFRIKTHIEDKGVGSCGRCQALEGKTDAEAGHPPAEEAGS